MISKHGGFTTFMQEKKLTTFEQAAQFELLISEIKQLSREIHQPFARFLCLYTLTPTMFRFLFGGNQPENSLLGPTLVHAMTYITKIPIVTNLLTAFIKQRVDLFAKATELQLNENMKIWFELLKQGQFQEACQWLISYPEHEVEINNQVRALWCNLFDAKNWDAKEINANCEKLKIALRNNPTQLKRELLPFMQTNSQSLSEIPEEFGAELGAFYIEVIASAYLTSQLADKILNYYLNRNPLGLTRLKVKQDTLNLLRIDSVNPNQLKIYQPSIQELKVLRIALKKQKSTIRKVEWLLMGIGLYFFYSTALNPNNWSFLLLTALVSNIIPNIYCDLDNWRQNSNFDRNMKTFTQALDLI